MSDHVDRALDALQQRELYSAREHAAGALRLSTFERLAGALNGLCDHDWCLAP